MSGKKLTWLAFFLLVMGLCLLGLYFNEWRTPTSLEPTPRYGGSYVYASDVRIGPLDPRQILWHPQKLALSLIFDPLITVDKDLQFTPRLCASWAISKDGQRFTCQLRKGVKFHNGQPLTAADVVFSLNYLAQANGPEISTFKYVKGIDAYWSGKANAVRGFHALDPQRIEIRMNRSFPRLVSALASPRFVVFPQAFGGQTPQQFFRHPVGTGPFVFSAQDDEQLIAKANPDYYLGRPYLDQVMIRAYSYTGALEAFKKGEVNDISAYAPNAGLIQLPDAKFYPFPLYWTWVLFVNNSRPPFDDIRYRRFLFSMIDKERIARECSPNSTVATSLLSEGIMGHKAQSDFIGFDLAQARQMLRDFGRIPPGVKIYCSSDGFQDCVTRVVNETFQAVGIPWEMKQISVDEVISMFLNKTLPAHLELLSVKNEDPYTVMQYFDSKNKENLSRIADLKIDRLLAQVLVTEDPFRKVAIYQEINDIVAQKAYALPLLYPGGLLVIDKRYRGAENRVLNYYIDFSRIWKEKDYR